MPTAFECEGERRREYFGESVLRVPLVGPTSGTITLREGVKREYGTRGFRFRHRCNRDLDKKIYGFGLSA